MREGLPYVIELLTPKQSDQNFEKALETFAGRYRKILDRGAAVSIPDNPLGNIHFTAMETVGYLTLPFHPDLTLLHLNTFHRKTDLDAFLAEAASRGLKRILVISGDGGPRLIRLEPEDIGAEARTVTSVELLAHIRREYPGTFTCGAAFNQYEPAETEWEKLLRKVDAGAEFIVTQPVIAADPAVDRLETLDIPVWVGAWMSRRIERLLECIGREVAIQGTFDPDSNLAALDSRYTACGLYLSQLSFKKDWNPILTRP